MLAPAANNIFADSVKPQNAVEIKGVRPTRLSCTFTSAPFAIRIFTTLGSRELYNLEADPLEERNLADDDHVMLSELDEAFDEWEKAVEMGTVLEPKLSEETIRQLEALGYVAK